MITKIIAKNFLSWKDLDFTINNGISLIDGWNEDDQTSEGSGKSGCVNALCWGLYGKLPKDVKIDEVIRRGTKSCSVEIIFTDYSIIRQRGPNKLYIKMNGQLIAEKDAKETQKRIESLIGLSFEAFCQTIYFAQNYPKKFITANQEEKAIILSEIQDLSKFDEARTKVKNDLSQIKQAIENTRLDHQKQLNTLQKIDFDIQLIEQSINSFNEKKALEIQHLQSSIQSNEQEIIKWENNILNLQKEYTALEKELSSYNEEDLMKEKVEIELKLNQIHQLLSQIQNGALNNQNIERSIKTRENLKNDLIHQYNDLLAFINNPSDQCNTCGTILGKKDTTEARNKVNTIPLEVDNLQAEINELSNQLINPENNESQKQELNYAKQELTKLKTDIEQKRDEFKKKIINKNYLLFEEGKLIEHINQIKVVIQSLSSNLNELHLKTSDLSLQEKLQTLIEQKNQYYYHVVAKSLESLELLARKQQHLEILYKGFKDIKVHIFNSLLNEITIKTNTYLQKLFEVDINIQFINDNNKIQTILKYDGEERGLGLLSGGQFRRVALASDLALSEIVNKRNGNKFNLKILDEVFKDLSEESMTKCLKLLQSLNIRTILIEHNSIFKPIVDQVYKVRLENGVSQLYE